MNKWFRFYSDAMRNPKVAKLADNDFRLWVELLAVASENDGKIPNLEDLKHLLRRRLDHLKGGVKRLISNGLIDVLEGGYEPHNWTKFQYKSDSSTDRVRKHRSKRNVSVTPPDTDTDTEEEKNTKKSTARGTLLPDDFVMPDDWIAWAQEKKGWSENTVNKESEVFVLWWQAKAGAGARKKDWKKTWQVWVNNSTRKNDGGGTTSFADHLARKSASNLTT